ncbi:transporter substrate-binding domain-containing protein [Mesobacterium sp. TK19101]|uniref:Transporter substrate-binding domain-containing protein n=1 Tax=Mesobacterium hydrothermale TaxID=3111907 RepID=A0ABU6HH00_9RHOB|nr:transporter substrate-binding domain-containing protein [Mesobacterium sp. TK19101]MEC3861738.1 transporter substrate-binding domain-containing protein [Mesobacterium sp. TK19101]
MPGTLRAGLLSSLLLAIWPALPAQARCSEHVPQARPQNASRDIVGQDLDTILERGFITFAAYEDFPPWSYEQGGNPVGVDIDIGRLIAEALGVTARFILVAPGETLEDDLRNWIWKGPVVGGSVANVMLHVPYDSAFACRVEQFVFTGQYHVEEVAIAYRRDAYPDDPPVPAYFRFDSVAVENDSIADFYLSAFPGGQVSRNVQRFPTMAAAMKGLTDGKTKAAMGPLAQLEAGLSDELAVHAPPLPGFAVGSWVAGVGVHVRYRALAYAVDDAIVAAIQDGRMAQIFAAHGLSFRPPEMR